MKPAMRSLPEQAYDQIKAVCAAMPTYLESGSGRQPLSRSGPASKDWASNQNRGFFRNLINFPFLARVLNERPDQLSHYSL